MLFPPDVFVCLLPMTFANPFSFLFLPIAYVRVN